MSLSSVFFYTMSTECKKRVKIELRGETLLNHYISLYRGGRGEGGKWENVAAQSVGSRKCHGKREREKKKKAQSNATFRRKLRAISFCICSLSLRVDLLLSSSFPPLPDPPPPHQFFLKANFTKMSFISLRTKFLSDSLFVFLMIIISNHYVANFCDATPQRLHSINVKTVRIWASGEEG
jgi:hypothetical protein